MIVEVEDALLPHLPQGFTQVDTEDPIIQEKMMKQKEMVVILDVYTKQLTPVDIDTYNALIQYQKYAIQSGQPYYGPSLQQLQQPQMQNQFMYQQRIINPYMQQQQGFIQQPQMQIDPMTGQPMPPIQTRHVKASPHEATTSGDPVSTSTSTDTEEIVIPENPEEAAKMIDDLINNLQQNKENTNGPATDWGLVRYGNESMGHMSHNELITHCLDKAFMYAPEPGLNYNLLPSGGMLELGIFHNGNKIDSFTIDPYFYGGKGMPIIVNADVILAYDVVGHVKSSVKKHIPLGYTSAVRQVIFRKIPGQPQGVDKNLYEQMSLSMYRNPSTYYLIDTSIYGLPDDIWNYKEFGDKIQAINEKYPFKARYRLADYTDNNNFILKSDGMVKEISSELMNPESLNVIITVSGNKLTIEEPNNNTINIEL